MGSYTVIADTSSSIVSFIRSVIVPEPVKKIEHVGLCQPDEKGNFILGIYLYHIAENPDMYSQKKIKLDMEHYKDPPTSYYLYYMIFSHSESEVGTRIIDEQRIIGKVLQQINDYRVIPQEFLIGTLKENNEMIHIQPISVTVDEKATIWGLFNQPYHTSFFYKVGPIFIDSDRIREVKRVVKAEFTTGQK